MKSIIGLFVLVCLLSIGSVAAADVFFEEQFSGPTLDPSIWRTEILTSGARWCDSYPGNWWGPGYWVDEGSACYGVAAHSPYGSAILSDGLLHLSSNNGQACPYVVSRLPGSVSVFPVSGDFTFRTKLRYDHVTPWGTFLMVDQTESSEPIGSNPIATQDELLFSVAANGDNWDIWSSLNGSFGRVAFVPSTVGELHEFALACVGHSFTISVDGQVVYGPVTSNLRPTVIWMGNPALAYWYPTDWEGFSVDYIRVELPGPPTGACCFANGACLQGTQADCQSLGGNYVGDGAPCDPNPCEPTPVQSTTWGQIKASYR